MVRKPQEGICGSCGSDDMEFLEDGSGICNKCNRRFKWDTGSGSPSGKKTLKPRRTPTADRYTGYVNILIIGFLLLIAGYSLLFSMHAVSEWSEEPVRYASTMIIFSLLFINVGIVIIGLGLVLGAVRAEHLGEEIRAWMFMAMAILLGVFLGLGNFLLIVNLL